jgi:DNA-binding NtrC family response regulator
MLRNMILTKQDIRRDLIVFQSKHSRIALFNELASHQWNVHIAYDIFQAFDLLKKYKFYAGLCVVEKCNDELYLEQLKKLLSNTKNINWVMGLPKACLLGVESRLIAEYCYDYLTLPVDTEHLLFALGHAYGMAEITTSPYKKVTDFPANYGIIGNSPEMKNLFKRITKVSKEDSSVLIEGETGTGKELIANAIHNHSSRADKPIVAINCGAFPKDLIQAELFGYEKGAFTGAQQRRIGRIESAQGGTLFLDEIGDLPLSQQVNLLRFLQEKVIERVGGTEKIPIDVRIIAATHVDLKKAVRAGKFREDLYYRLRVLQLKIPPLRERDGDIEVLAWYFFNKFSNQGKRKPRGFSADARYSLLQHDWPGNVRELMNCINHAVVMSENRFLTPADLGLEKRYKERGVKTLEEARAETDRETIMSILQNTGYNISHAAENLGISRVYLYRLMDKYELSPEK